MKTAQKLKENLIGKVILGCGVPSVAVVVLIFAFLLRDAFSLFGSYSPVDFLTGRKWYPISEPPVFGILPLVLGSMLVTG